RRMNVFNSPRERTGRTSTASPSRASSPTAAVAPACAPLPAWVNGSEGCRGTRPIKLLHGTGRGTPAGYGRLWAVGGRDPRAGWVRPALGLRWRAEGGGVDRRAPARAGLPGRDRGGTGPRRLLVAAGVGQPVGRGSSAGRAPRPRR